MEKCEIVWEATGSFRGESRWKSFYTFNAWRMARKMGQGGKGGGWVKISSWWNFQVGHLGDIVNWQVPVLTDNVNHIFVPLLQLALYKSSLLYATKVWAIRHVLKSNAKKNNSIVFFVEGADTKASKVTNSLATQRCGAKSTNSRNIGDAVNWICIWLFTFYGYRLHLHLHTIHNCFNVYQKFYFTRQQQQQRFSSTKLDSQSTSVLFRATPEKCFNGNRGEKSDEIFSTMEKFSIK